MSARPGRKNGKRREQRESRNAKSKAYIDLAKQLAAVFSAGVYTKEDLQSAVCSYVAEMKQAGETGDTVVQTAQRLAAEVGERFPAAGNTQAILGDILTWCLAEYYRESA